MAILMTQPSSLLSLDRIREAYECIPAIFRDSPQFVSEGLSRQLGCRVLCKVECVNPIRSFKGRGAWYFLAREGTSPEPIVTASAGNFGLGLAYAARERGQRLVIFAATTADPAKVARMRDFGADVRLAGLDFDAAKDEARGFAAHHHLRFIEDGREPAIAEGAGTIALELCRWPEPIDSVVVPVGNGGLASGIGHWIHAHIPACRVIGVGAEGAPAMALSWRSRQMCTTVAAETVADTIAVRIPIAQALSELQTAIDDMVLVTDDALRDSVRLLHSELGVVVEPSGAASLAALLQLDRRGPERLVAIVISGGNLAPALFPTWLF
jgi:threonine dehydratase